MASTASLVGLRFVGMSVLSVRVAVRISNEPLPCRDRTVDVLGGNPPLFHETVRNHGGDILVKEIKYPVIHGPEANAQLVNAVAQVIGFRAAQLMPKLPKPLQLDTAFIKHSIRKTIEPVQDRDGAVIIAIENDRYSRHPYLLDHCSHVCEQWSRGSRHGQYLKNVINDPYTARE
jgi:hypothetical protein